VFRFLPIAVVLFVAGCGGDGENGAPFGSRTQTSAASTSTPTNDVAGTQGTPTPSVTSSPSPGASTPDGTYTVVDGDTLSAIAERFATTVDDLVAANDLADADSLFVGQVLEIVGPSATPTPTVAAQ